MSASTSVAKCNVFFDVFLLHIVRVGHAFKRRANEMVLLCNLNCDKAIKKIIPHYLYEVTKGKKINVFKKIGYSLKL